MSSLYPDEKLCEKWYGSSLSDGRQIVGANVTPEVLSWRNGEECTCAPTCSIGGELGEWKGHTNTGDTGGPIIPTGGEDKERFPGLNGCTGRKVSLGLEGGKGALLLDRSGEMLPDLGTDGASDV